MVQIEINMSREEKYKVGKSLKVITDKLNIPTKHFNNHDIIQKASINKYWSSFTDRFIEERKEYLKNIKVETKNIYVHGGLKPDIVHI